VADTVVLPGVDKAAVVPSTLGNTVDSTTVEAPQDGRRRPTIATNILEEDRQDTTRRELLLRGGADSRIREAAALALALATTNHRIATAIQMPEARLLHTTVGVHLLRLGAALLPVTPIITDITRSNSSSTSSKRVERAWQNLHER
jgi:hypothetical protein